LLFELLSSAREALSSFFDSIDEENEKSESDLDDSISDLSYIPPVRETLQF